MALARKLTAKIYEIKAHNGNVTCLDLGETGRVLVTGGQDRNVNLWAIGQEECFMSLTGHNRPIDCVRFAYNDDFVYSADDIGIIRRWDLNAQTICSTLNGHMKSIRTLDFNPSGEYVVSGSNDTTVRLWDVRNHNKCIKIYRGHISHINSVKFSPDGLWIASAGTEGTIVIWDIRKSKQIMEFTEKPPAAAITCIQFHPFEFLLAVGRIDGNVSIYDLESQSRILCTDTTTQFHGHPIKCITFSDNGDCLFVGTAAGISVIGWEPDREFDNIKSTWPALGDMKIVNRKLICGSYDQDYVAVNAVSIDRIIPFYNPSNTEPRFSHNSTTRKSFSRGNQKLRLSIGVSGSKPARLVEENEDNKSPSIDGQSSPNLSLELVDESLSDSVIDLTNSPPSLLRHPQQTSARSSPPPPPINSMMTHPLLNNTYNLVTHSTLVHNKKASSTAAASALYDYPTSLVPNNDHTLNSMFGVPGNGHSSSHYNYDGGPSSLRILPDERSDIYLYNHSMDPYASTDIEYNLNESNPPVINNYEHTEMIEDFPVNQNLHQPINGSTTSGVASSPLNVNTTAGRSTTTTTTTSTKKATTSNGIYRRNTQHLSGKTNANTYNSSKLSQVSSVSSMELHKLDDNMLLKKSSSSHLVVNKNKRPIHGSPAQVNKENTRNKNINVQIITKPPTRSRTTLDMRSPHQQQHAAAAAAHRQSHIPLNYRPDLIPQTGRGLNRNIDDNYEIEMLSSSHEQVYQELSNRHATLQLLRNSTRANDIVGALRQAIKMQERTIFVDLLGAILEKTSIWNLDLCLLLLPEIYELLQSPHKFHYTRACDTLRVILSNFLPIIQDNLDPWAANGLGVDVTREDRQRKCIECQRWLLQIRNLPETNHFGGTTLTQLQNMINI